MCGRSSEYKKIPKRAVERAIELMDKEVEYGRRSWTPEERAESIAFDDFYGDLRMNMDYEDIEIPEVIKKYFV